MSSMSSCTPSPWLYPLAQLLPAPPPWSDRKMFSGLNRLRMSEFWMPLMTLREGHGDAEVRRWWCGDEEGGQESVCVLCAQR